MYINSIELHIIASMIIVTHWLLPYRAAASCIVCIYIIYIEDYEVELHAIQSMCGRQLST